MLHHVSNHRDYWFCRRCWSEMPNIAELKASPSSRQLAELKVSPSCERQPQIVNLSEELKQLKKAVVV